MRRNPLAVVAWLRRLTERERQRDVAAASGALRRAEKDVSAAERLRSELAQRNQISVVDGAPSIPVIAGDVTAADLQALHLQGLAVEYDVRDAQHRREQAQRDLLRAQQQLGAARAERRSAELASERRSTREARRASRRQERALDELAAARWGRS